MKKGYSGTSKKKRIQKKEKQKNATYEHTNKQTIKLKDFLKEKKLQIEMGHRAGGNNSSWKILVIICLKERKKENKQHCNY